MPELQEEIAYFNANRLLWLNDHKNEYAIVQGRHVAGFYPDFESAFRAGIERWGIKDLFLVKVVTVEDEVFLIF